MRTAWLALALCLGLPVPPAAAQFDDPGADGKSLPAVPAGFDVTLFAREPLVRQPGSLAFDARGRLFVGMGPQWRSPTRETPGDSVVIVQDTDGDGRADTAKVFATGFNCIQGLAWRGHDLWVANAPDLTVVRDLDGDDEADEYLRIYTDLGNLEHGLHGLHWAPDGKLYMSKGNSKGLTRPGRIAPKPFRELWGVTAPDDAPDFPPPQKFSKGQYQRAYHDPADDWGRSGGILRCDDGGHNLEIVARGFRNPWDIAFDSGFNWLGTDNDQTGGDRVFMPFFGAHFGWNHSWSSHWSLEPHAPTAPVSGPLFEGSGTGIVYFDVPQFPPEYRGVFFINDWLRKTTFVWRPQWDGALLRPHGGDWEPFAEGGPALFRPTDLEVGPDGALWVLGWGRGYGAEWKDGQLVSEGRIFRIAWRGAPPHDWNAPKRHKPAAQWSVAELIEDFAGPLPVWRTNAQRELLRRGLAVQAALLEHLRRGQLSPMQETWTAWTLGLLAVDEPAGDDLFAQWLQADAPTGTNLQIQAIRILAHRCRQAGAGRGLPDAIRHTLHHPQARLRFAAVEAVHRTRQTWLVPDLLTRLARESDPAVFYAGWQALRGLVATDELRALLADDRARVRRAALLALLETHALSAEQVASLVQQEQEPAVAEVAQWWLAKAGRGRRVVAVPQRAVPAAPAVPGWPLVWKIEARSGRQYRAIQGGFETGAAVYTDRTYRLSHVPDELAGADLIQTANDDDGSSGDVWLTAEALLPVRVLVAIDRRQAQPPRWVREHFQRTEYTVAIDEGARLQLWAKTFPAGPIQLGGNTDDGRAGGKGNYFVAIQAQPLQRLAEPTTIGQVMDSVTQADPARGEVLFRHPRAAGCIRCHRLDHTSTGFGPPLADISRRANLRHIVQSILDPSAVITQGYSMLTVLTDDGQSHSGLLLEESDLTLSIGLSTGERLDLPKDKVEARKTSNVSAMPSMAEFLSPQQVAEIVAFLQTQTAPPPTGAPAESQAPPSAAAPADSKASHGAADGFSWKLKADRLAIAYAGRPVADFVFRDEKILRPYFANVRTPGGVQATRNHPPDPKVDATDHDTMHPGIWLAFGDISGHDFWRNRGRIEHVAFTQPPAAKDGDLTFATRSRLRAPGGETLCELDSRFLLAGRPSGWLLVWDATFRSDERDFVFGDQEEMGFGARVATPLAEIHGGHITASTGRTTAAATWGQPALWCDYSGTIGRQRVGITLMPAPSNFRASWWHNRNYGVFVANPFGRAAMRQGDKSAVVVRKGESLRLRFGALVHEGADYDPQQAYRDFLKRVP